MFTFFDASMMMVEKLKTYSSLTELYELNRSVRYPNGKRTNQNFLSIAPLELDGRGLVNYARMGDRKQSKMRVWGRRSPFVGYTQL